MSSRLVLVSSRLVLVSDKLILVSGRHVLVSDKLLLVSSTCRPQTSPSEEPWRGYSARPSSSSCVRCLERRPSRRWSSVVGRQATDKGNLFEEMV